MSVLDPEHLEIIRRMRDDLKYYSRHCLKIKTKEATIEPFIFNSAQDYIHAKIEDQLMRKGWVRVIIVKGRQQGCSTYVEARYFWKATMSTAKTVCILSHEDKSTKNLYEKVDFYDRHCPPHMKPKRLASSYGNTIKYSNEAEYVVVTAGSEDSGRGNTAQLQHQSERAFFKKVDKVDAGVGQVVSNHKGSEVIKESTGNGKNEFYQEVLAALDHRGKFEVIFVPWHWQTEYQEKFDTAQERKEFELALDKTELELIELYNLTLEQLKWRRDKIVELKTERLFKQEYPNSLMEAFQSGENSFYEPMMVERARKLGGIILDRTAPLILGVDPARKGDRTVLVLRQGREIKKIWKYDEMDTGQLVGIIADIIDEYDIDKVFIDYGMGYGTVDGLKYLGYGSIVQGVHFGETPSDVQYLNKRAEMAFAFRDWLKDAPVKLPDDDDMAADIDSMPDSKMTATRRHYFPDKKEIKKMYGRSPDILDAIMLTFAYKVRTRKHATDRPMRTTNTKKGSQLSTLSRIRTGRREDAPHRRRAMAA